MPSPLKVMIWHWGRRGGGPRYTLELARVLAGRDDLEVHLSLSKQSDFYTDFEGIAASNRFDIDTYQSSFGFMLRSVGLPFIRKRFLQYIRSKNIDVVFCTMDHLWNLFVCTGFRKSGAVYLLTVHDATRHPGEDRWWRKLLLKKDIETSDSALVLTRSVGQSLTSTYDYPAERIFVSAHGHFGDASTDAMARHLRTDRPLRLLFFGRILRYKGLDLVLQALPLIRKRFSNLQLEIWGSGDISPYLADIRALGGIRLENRWIDEEEIVQIFSDTDLTVLPYREASQSGVVATAFAAGMPCVVTPIPGLCEQIIDGETGIVAAGFSPREFADAVCRALEDKGNYNMMSRKCIEILNGEMSWDSIGLSVLHALKSSRAMGKRRGKDS